MARRTGRRPGNPDTRDAILNAAREAFAERGYDGASIRHIATGAGVDPALVHHYFGNKEQLFLETVGAPIDPRELLPQVIAGGVPGVGRRLVRTFLTLWDSPRGGMAIALLRSAVTNEWTARLIREFLVSQILRRAIKELDLKPEDGALRANLVASQLLGLATARYILKLEPLASASRDQVVAAIGPTIQRYISGDLEQDAGGCARLDGVDDKQIIQTIDALVDEEHRLRTRRQTGEVTSEDEAARLRDLEESLDQCWDLLRRRRAARDAGTDPDAAHPQPRSQVEGYLQ